MKQFIFIIFVITSLNVSAQSLVNIYTKGNVKLVPDREYGKDNDWDKIFDSYNDSIGKTWVGNRMSITMIPDGSIVISHPYKNYYSKFDLNGKFIKRFEVIGNSGKPIKKIPAIQGVINNEFFTSADNTGKVFCFDLNGNYRKTLTLNYGVISIIPLKNNKLGVTGFAVGSRKVRDFVAIVDYETNVQKIIWSRYSEGVSLVEDRRVKNTNPAYKSEIKKYPLLGISNYYNRIQAKTPILHFLDDHLVVTFPFTGEIEIFDLSGKLLSKQNTNWEKQFISINEQKTRLQKVIDEYREKPLIENPEVTKEQAQEARNERVNNLNHVLNKIEKPIELPAVSNILKDSDNNLLFFEIPKESGKNKFNVWVYSEEKSFVCQSTFECDEYDLVISPSKMIFYNGYIYALQTLKNVSGNPVRLVRFKLK